MKHFGLKGLSILIAVLLCIYVNSENNISTARIFVAVEVKDLPSDKVIVWQLKKQVEVEIRGPSFLVSRITASPPILRLKLPQEVGARYTAQINKTDLDINAPLQVISIEPSTIAFTIENKIARELPIRLPQIGVIDSNLRIEEISLSPDKVTVVGPESEVRELQFVSSAPLDLREVRQSTEEEIVLRVPGKQTELSHSAVRAKVSISPINVKREFADLPVEIRTGSGSAVQVEPSTVSVTVLGTKDLIEKIESHTVIPFVRIPTASNQNDTVNVQVDLPPNITIDSVEPRSVTVLRAKAPKKVQKK